MNAETTARPVCRGCGTQLAATLLACPSCGALTRSTELTRLAEAAEAAERGGDLAGAASAWREALTLLPSAAPQRQAVVTRLESLTRRIDAAPAVGRPGVGGGSGTLKRVWAALAAVVLILLTKGKLLLLGLTKAGTLVSMFGFLAVYWQLYGWQLAAGIVLSIYAHEMGHVFALARYGVQAEAPMFVPGFGAFVRHRGLHTPHEQASVGLAGPLWGLGAAIASAIVYWATEDGVWGAIAGLGALLNLLNLAPVWQLDGARGFLALARRERWVVAATAAAAALLASQPAGYAVAATAAYQAYRGNDAPARSDHRVLVTFVGLLVALTALMAATAEVARVR